jgi:hypothetical protein
MANTIPKASSTCFCMFLLLYKWDDNSYNYQGIYQGKFELLRGYGSNNSTLYDFVILTAKDLRGVGHGGYNLSPNLSRQLSICQLKSSPKPKPNLGLHPT